MANGKTFADMKKPVRQPTPEQIAAFEETGRARILDQQVRTETRFLVRLTIDLDEPVHTRFKTAWVMTKRKMVDEVRALIERRAGELEGEAGRVPQPTDRNRTVEMGNCVLTANLLKDHILLIPALPRSNR